MVRCRLRFSACACAWNSIAHQKRVRSTEMPRTPNSWLYRLKGLGFTGPMNSQKWLWHLFVSIRSQARSSESRRHKFGH